MRSSTSITFPDLNTKTKASHKGGFFLIFSAIYCKKTLAIYLMWCYYTNVSISVNWEWVSDPLFFANF